MSQSKQPKYTSIQVTKKSQSILKGKKRKDESYEEYFRRIGAL